MRTLLGRSSWGQDRRLPPVSGLLAPDDGETRVEDVDADDMTPAERKKVSTQQMFATNFGIALLVVAGAASYIGNNMVQKAKHEGGGGGGGGAPNLGFSKPQDEVPLV